MSRPFRALNFINPPITRASPFAGMSCPFGAKYLYSYTFQIVFIISLAPMPSPRPLPREERKKVVTEIIQSSLQPEETETEVDHELPKSKEDPVVLIVEDNGRLRRALKVGLEATGAVRVVGEAPSGEEALAILDQMVRAAWRHSQ